MYKKQRFAAMLVAHLGVQQQSKFMASVFAPGAVHAADIEDWQPPPAFNARMLCWQWDETSQRVKAMGIQIEKTPP